MADVPKRLLVVVPPGTEVLYMTSPSVVRVIMADVEAFEAVSAPLVGPHPSFFGEPVYKAKQYRDLRVVES